MIVISFDIDGTLDCGDPPGPLPVSVVATARDLGNVVGSCSDRTLSEQRELWRRLGYAVDFTLVKQDMGKLVGLFFGAPAVHVGDTMVDYSTAIGAGISFVSPDDVSAGAPCPPSSAATLVDRITVLRVVGSECPWPRRDLPASPRH